MRKAELHFDSLLGIARKIQAREISAVEVVQDQLKRISAFDQYLASYAQVTADWAIEQAETADREISQGRIRGPLHGAPIAVKDLIWTKDITTASGTLIFSDFVPEEDATTMARLYAAGAILLGKLTTAEAAYSVHHPAIPVPVNPWSREVWSGASSSGSGVAVAAGLCYGALGTDTSGSIRLPAAVNGIVGLKPTWGRVSRHGVLEAAGSLDHVGPMARTVGDVAAMLGAIAGSDTHDPTASKAPVAAYPYEAGGNVRGVKLGFDPRVIDMVDPATAFVLQEAMAVFRSLGVQIIEIALPSFDEIGPALVTLAGAELAVAHAGTFPSRRSEYGLALAGFLDGAHMIDDDAMQAATRYRQYLKSGMDSLFQHVEALLLPAISIARLETGRMRNLGEDMEALDALVRFTCPFNLTGLPAMAIPGGVNFDGSPISFQLAGPAFCESRLFDLGLDYQSETDWHLRHPSLSTAQELTDT